MRAKLLLLALLAVVCWEVVSTLAQSSAAPSDSDWVMAATGLRGLREAGEPILVAPQWAEDVGRQHLGDMVDIELASLADIDRFPRVWQLSSRGATHPWLAGLTPRKTWRFGRVQLALFVHEPAAVLFDFRAKLGDAEVDRVGDTRRPCVRRGKRHVCDPHHAWSWVGPRLMEIGFRPYTCIYAHPLAQEQLRITFDDVPLGEQLVGYTGIGDYISRRDAKGPVLFQVFVDDELLTSVRHLNDWPFTRFEATTTPYANGTHQVRFEISAPDIESRTFCFHAEARR